MCNSQYAPRCCRTRQGRRAACLARRGRCTQNDTFRSFPSQCVSRACLGKVVHHNWHQKVDHKTPFLLTSDTTPPRMDPALPHLRKTPLTFFECFPHVCPEPVLVKCSFLYTNGAKSGVFRTAYQSVCTYRPKNVRPCAINRPKCGANRRIQMTTYTLNAKCLLWIGQIDPKQA